MCSHRKEILILQPTRLRIKQVKMSNEDREKTKSYSAVTHRVLLLVQILLWVYYHYLYLDALVDYFAEQIYNWEK